MPTDAELQQMKMKEFIQMFPITAEIAGLPKGEMGRLFTEGQLEVRLTQLKNAFRLAKQLLYEISKPPEVDSES